MIIQHKGLERHFKRIQKVRELRFFGKRIYICKIQSWVFLPALRASENKKTRYALKIGEV
nr:MAG TPA: hypothetical protein [Caudoviricetes sp.]